jgi:hypothetical protein
MRTQTRTRDTRKMRKTHHTRDPRTGVGDRCNARLRERHAGQQVVLQIELPADHTRERARGHTRVSVMRVATYRPARARTRSQHVPPASCREDRDAETRAGVRDVSLSLAPYRRLVSPLKTSAGRATSWLDFRLSDLRTTHERGRGGTRVSGMRVAAYRPARARGQTECPADHTRESARGHARQWWMRVAT